MARCPYCNEILKDEWLKKIGAALMGKVTGKAKARSRELATRAGQASVAARRARKKAIAQ